MAILTCKASNKARLCPIKQPKIEVDEVVGLYMKYCKKCKYRGDE